MWAADYTEPLSTYMHEGEVFFVDIVRWRQINPVTMAEARAKAGEPLWKTNLDLSKVGEIGFSDLMQAPVTAPREMSPETGSRFMGTR